MTTHPLGRLCGSVFAALLAATAVAGCSETQPPSTTGIGGDDGTQPTSPLCSGDARAAGIARPRRARAPARPVAPSRRFRRTMARRSPRPSRRPRSAAARCGSSPAARRPSPPIPIATASTSSTSTTKSVRATISLNAGDEPGRVVADAAGRAHVALRHGGALVSIDTVAGVLLQRRDVCAAPRGLAYDAATDLVHVACSGGELVSLPAAGGNAVRTVTLAGDLRDVAVDGPRLRVSRFLSAELLTVEADGTVSGVVTPGSFRAVAARGGQQFTPGMAWKMAEMPDGGGVMMLHQRGVVDEVQPVVGGYGAPTPATASSIRPSRWSRPTAASTAGPRWPAWCSRSTWRSRPTESGSRSCRPATPPTRSWAARPQGLPDAGVRLGHRQRHRRHHRLPARRDARPVQPGAAFGS